MIGRGKQISSLFSQGTFLKLSKIKTNLRELFKEIAEISSHFHLEKDKNHENWKIQRDPEVHLNLNDVQRWLIFWQSRISWCIFGLTTGKVYDELKHIHSFTFDCCFPLPTPRPRAPWSCSAFLARPPAGTSWSRAPRCPDLRVAAGHRGWRPPGWFLARERHFCFAVVVAAAVEQVLCGAVEVECIALDCHLYDLLKKNK